MPTARSTRFRRIQGHESRPPLERPRAPRYRTRETFMAPTQNDLQKLPSSCLNPENSPNSFSRSDGPKNPEKPAHATTASRPDHLIPTRSVNEAAPRDREDRGRVPHDPTIPNGPSHTNPKCQRGCTPRSPRPRSSSAHDPNIPPGLSDTNPKCQRKVTPRSRRPRSSSTPSQHSARPV